MKSHSRNRGTSNAATSVRRPHHARVAGRGGASALLDAHRQSKRAAEADFPLIGNSQVQLFHQKPLFGNIAIVLEQTSPDQGVLVPLTNAKRHPGPHAR